jgi:hypothetical protein
MQADERHLPAGGNPEIRNASNSGSRWVAARFGAVRCGACARALAAGEPVWQSQVDTGHGSRQIPTCGGCRIGGRWLPSKPCQGCGRPVASRATRRRRPRVFCSDRCPHRHYNLSRAAVLVLARRKRCVVCGRSFEAGRCDALTCSPACRQRKYRGRTEGSAHIIDPASGGGP